MPASGDATSISLGILGAVGGDVAGSAYGLELLGKEGALLTPRSTFTDHSVMTLATAEVLLDGGSYAEVYRRYGRKYPYRGYGERFSRWLASDTMEPSGSLSDGSATRVSPVGFFGADLVQVLAEAACSAVVTHRHPEGIKGAQAVAGAIFLARTGANKRTIRSFVESTFGYDLSCSWDHGCSDASAGGSCSSAVAEALRIFLDSSDYLDALRKAVLLGGEGNARACIAGGVGAAFYRAIPESFAQGVLARLDGELRLLLERFDRQYGVKPLADQGATGKGAPAPLGSFGGGAHCFRQSPPHSSGASWSLAANPKEV